jgi:hypothetical protein
LKTGDCKEETHYHPNQLVLSSVSDVVPTVPHVNKPRVSQFPRDVDFEELELDEIEAWIGQIDQQTAQIERDIVVQTVEPKTPTPRLRDVVEPDSEYALECEHSGVVEVEHCGFMGNTLDADRELVKSIAERAATARLATAKGKLAFAIAALQSRNEQKAVESETLNASSVPLALVAEESGCGIVEDEKHNSVPMVLCTSDCENPKYLGTREVIVYSTSAVSVGHSSWWNRAGDWVHSHLPFVHKEETWITNDAHDLTLHETIDLSSSSVASWRFGLRHGNRAPYRYKTNKGTEYLTAANFKSYAKVRIFTALYAWLDGASEDAVRNLNKRKVIEKSTTGFQVMSSFLQAVVSAVWQKSDIQHYLDVQGNDIGKTLVLNTMQHYLQQKMLTGIRLECTAETVVKPTFFKRVLSKRSRRVDPHS